MGKRRKVILFVIIGLIAGIIYPVFGDPLETYLPILNGVFTGLIGSVSIALIEIFYFGRHRVTGKFVFTLITKSMLYLGVLAIVIITVKTFNESLYYKVGFWSYLMGENMDHFLMEEDFELILLYALAIIGFVIFINQISQKMGPGVLWNLISGKYHKPKKESIILMYIDLKSSTALIEDIGAEQYHHFINRFYSDLSGLIISRKGKVYRYVGDQITIFWNENEGLKNGNCIEFYNEVKAQMKDFSGHYIKDFGYLPEFRACCHMGELVIGQIGDVKSQIVFHGKDMYIGEMIEKKCKELNEDFLVSGRVLSGIKSKFTGDFRHMGKLGIDHGPDQNIYALEVLGEDRYEN